MSQNPVLILFERERERDRERMEERKKEDMLHSWAHIKFYLVLENTVRGATA